MWTSLTMAMAGMCQGYSNVSCPKKRKEADMSLVTRRGLLKVLTGIVAAPAVIKVTNLMPVSVWQEVPKQTKWDLAFNRLGFHWVDMGSKAPGEREAWLYDAVTQKWVGFVKTTSSRGALIVNEPTLFGRDPLDFPINLT